MIGIYVIDRIIYGVYTNIWLGPQIMTRAAFNCSTWYFSLLPISFQLIMFMSQYMNMYWYSKWYAFYLTDYKNYMNPSPYIHDELKKSKKV